MEDMQNELPILVDKDFIQRRYGCGCNKAYEIIQTIRHEFNGGKANFRGKVLMSELLAWENTPERKYNDRL